MTKQGFHRWVWIIILLFGGILMIFGGVQDLLIFFSPELVPVPSWYSTSPIIGLICGLIVLTSAILNIIYGWQLRESNGDRELQLAYRVVFVSGIAFIADLISGYYGFGSLVAFVCGLWLIRQSQKSKP